MAIDIIKRATREKIESIQPWSGQNDLPGIIDVSLNAGQLSTGADECFSLFIDSLYPFINQLTVNFPFMHFYKKEQMHITLLTLFNGEPDIFEAQKNNLINISHDICNDFHDSGEVVVNFKEVFLTPNGSVILIGTSEKLTAFRKKIYAAYEFHDDLKKNIVHITLGRLLAGTCWENMNNIYLYLQEKGIISLPPLFIKRAKVIVSNGSLCHNLNKVLTRAFQI